MVRPIGFVRVTGIVLLSGLATACGSGGRDRDTPRPRPTIMSPNGEVLGTGDCRATFAAWLGRIDANRDGAVRRAEFIDDATAQFARMDLDHDGAVDPAELQRQRPPPGPPDGRRTAPTATRERTPYSSGGGFGDGPGGFGRPLAGTLGGSGFRPHGTGGYAGDFSLRPDPVMAADVNLDNRVTTAEFRERATRTFDRLDTNRDGVLSREELAADCAAYDDGR